MHKIKRWRYYCDFCKKANGSAYHMRNHETGCTANPGRVCGMCRISGGLQIPMTELLGCIGKDGAESLKQLKAVTENCPACILAAIRVSGVNELDPENPMTTPNSYIVYDFKKESDSFWNCHNEAQDQDQCYS